MIHSCAELSRVIFEAWNAKRREDLQPLHDEGCVAHTAPPGTPDGLDWVDLQYGIFTTLSPTSTSRIKT